jgi:hypothetical protein
MTGATRFVAGVRFIKQVFICFCLPGAGLRGKGDLRASRAVSVHVRQRAH